MAEKSVATRGGGFLVAEVRPDEVFTPEQFSDDQVMIGRTAESFVNDKVRPRLDEIEAGIQAGDYRLTVQLLREAGGLGLLGGDVAEGYGGMGLSKASTTLITEKTAAGSSFAISFGAHTGIGTLPIVLFGTEEQKRRYLPALVTGEKLAAYALTEPDAGSDALGGKTAARRSDNGQTFRISGEKQWITNSGFADLFVVYAKTEDKLTAFLVERTYPGVSVGPETKKMGLHGSSTCTVSLNDVEVPAENVLGEAGRGHIVAFNVLNIGRWKLAAGCLGSSKAILQISARYVQQRRQFGKTLAEFPAIQQKLAAMAARTFALESAVYRTSGLLDSALGALEADGAAAQGSIARAIGEYAIEASINKVLGSETLHFVADEGVQMHGGYGFIKGFEVERAYRDSRINRIFEGTNEINRLLVSGTLLQRAVKGELPLLDRVRQVQEEVTSLEPFGAGGAGGDQSAMASETAQLANLKRAALVLGGLGVQKYMFRVQDEQEFLMALADLAILIFSWESALLRAQRIEGSAPPGQAAMAIDLTRLYGEWAAEQAEMTARRALAGLEQGDTLHLQLALLRRLFRRVPADGVALGRRVAQQVLAGGGYPAIAPQAGRQVPAATG